MAGTGIAFLEIVSDLEGGRTGCHGSRSGGGAFGHLGRQLPGAAAAVVGGGGAVLAALGRRRHLVACRYLRRPRACRVSVRLLA